MPLTPPGSSLRQRAAPSTAAERESPTPSQLDILAERNERFATPSPFARAAMVLAIVAAILVLIAVLWWVAQSGDPAALGTAPMAVAPAAVDPLPLVAPTTASVGSATRDAACVCGCFGRCAVNGARTGAGFRPFAVDRRARWQVAGAAGAAGGRRACEGVARASATSAARHRQGA